MEENIIKRLDEQGAKIDAIYKSVEKTRKYFLIIIWVTIIMFILPIIGLAVVIPNFISTMETYGGLL